MHTHSKYYIPYLMMSMLPYIHTCCAYTNRLASSFYSVITTDLHSGHMIGASNIPFMDLFTSSTKTMKSDSELKKGTSNDNNGVH